MNKFRVNNTHTITVQLIKDKPPNCHASQFWVHKKYNVETLKTIVCQTTPLTKFPPGSFYLFMKCDVFRQKAGFLKMECCVIPCQITQCPKRL